MIGERIRALRLSKGISISKLAEKSGVAKSYISAIERSMQKNPSIQVIEKLASVMEVSVMDLVLPGEDAARDEHLDKEWLSLVHEAMMSGVSKGEFKEFLEFQKWRQRR